MEPAGPAATGHPLVAVLGRLEQVLAEAGQVPVFTLDAGTTASTPQQLVVLQSRLAAVTLTVLAHGDQVDVAQVSGAASTGTWFAHATRTTRPAAHRQARLAGSLADPTHACVAAAFAAGLLVEDQARVIIDAVDALPSTGEHAVTAQVIAEAEAHLVGLAAHHDARELRRLGLRLLEVVSPETADAYEAKKLQAQERRAAEQTRLTLSADGQGSVFVKGKIPDLHAAMLTTMLHAYAAPKHQAAQAAADGVPTPPRQPSPQRLDERSATSSRRWPHTTTHRPAGPARPWWSPSTSPRSPAQSEQATWTPDSPSAPGPPAGWPARPASSPPSWTATRPRWTWAAPDGSTPVANGPRSVCATAGAPPRAATGRPACATSTTTRPGPRAGPPTWLTPGCSAPTTTPGLTTPATSTPDNPTAPSPSTGGPECRAGGRASAGSARVARRVTRSRQPEGPVIVAPTGSRLLREWVQERADRWTG